MSKSRSVTPKPNILTNLPSTSGPTPSRSPTDDTTSPITVSTTAPTTTGESPNPSPSSSHFTHFHSFVSSQTSPDDLKHRHSSPESPPMAKRMRRRSPEHTARSQSTDSHSGGMADTDEPGRMSPTSPPPVAPLKKKRTRTLTTPHQSAVLHALLAQSRFPTTAMREEVGRSIGLSARKVQIWFQNQRQKARRPGSQSDATQQGTPAQHYSAFANAPLAMYPGLSAEPYPMVDREGRPVLAYSSYPPSEQTHGGDAPQLLGPGMPGRSPQRGRPVLQIASGIPTPYSRSPPAAPFSSRSLPGPRSFESERDMSPEEGFPIPRPQTHDPSRMLPPLNFSQPRRSLDPYILARSAPTTPSHGSFLGSPSPSPTFAHSLPEPHSYPTSALGLPPPFTLQPQPQWDTRPSSASWSHSGSRSARGSSGSPPMRLLKEPSPEFDDNGHTPRLEAAQPTQRAGRYDPVRAMFVPYSPTASDSARATSSSSASSAPGPSPSPPA